MVYVWINIDDILTHPPSLDNVLEALRYIMDVALILGIICQHCKTVSPTQYFKFFGFVYNTTSIPNCLSPITKSFEYLIQFIIQGFNAQLSRLIVSTEKGLLQSLIPFTPRNVGASFLHSIYTDRQQLQEVDQYGTKQFYFKYMMLSEHSRICLQWWT